ncbi:MAG: adenine phosphoribosyltransferase [Planctomycetota bacterium]
MPQSRTALTDPGWKTAIRDVPDFPKKGIVFKDITPLLKDGRLFRAAVDAIADRFAKRGVTTVVGIEARGFIIAPAVAVRLGVGFVPVRKPGKLPWKSAKKTYALEYGTDAIEIHTDAAKKGDRVLLVDDVLATGGTMAACIELVESLGAEVAGCAFLIELDFLKGREKLKAREIVALVHYD